jgi:hypothetical protein
MSRPIDVTGLCPFELLARLHNATQPLGAGWLHARGDIDAASAKEWLEENPRYVSPRAWTVDYVHGRPVKVFVSETPEHLVELHRADLYDRDAPGGEGSAARIVEQMRQE